MTQLSLAAQVYNHVKHSGPIDERPDALLQRFHSLLDDWELVEFWLNSDTDIQNKLHEECTHTIHGTINIIYARLILSEEEIEAVGIENIVPSGMTPKKIEALRGAQIEKINAIWGKNLASEHLSEDDIKVFLGDIETDHIWALGGENIALWGTIIKDLPEILSRVRPSQVEAFGGKNVFDPKIDEKKLARIWSSLSEEQIKAIWGENLVLEGFTNDNIWWIAKLSSGQLKVIGGENLAHIYTQDEIERYINFVAKMTLEEISSIGGRNIVKMSIAEIKAGIIPSDLFKWL